MFSRGVLQVEATDFRNGIFGIYSSPLPSLVDVRDSTFSYMYYAVYTPSQINLPPSTNFSFTNIDIENGRYAGIFIQMNAENVWIKNTRIDAAKYGIYTGSTSHVHQINHIHFDNVTICNAEYDIHTHGIGTSIGEMEVDDYLACDHAIDINSTNERSVTVKYCTASCPSSEPVSSPAPKTTTISQKEMQLM